MAKKKRERSSSNLEAVGGARLRRYVPPTLSRERSHYLFCRKTYIRKTPTFPDVE